MAPAQAIAPLMPNLKKINKNSRLVTKFATSDYLFIKTLQTACNVPLNFIFGSSKVLRFDNSEFTTHQIAKKLLK